MRDSEPFVSIIMPAFNAEQYITESINSVIGQSYENWELLIIDDGSTDSTNSIIEDFSHRDRRIRILTNDGNKGLVYTRNKGLREAKGDYIANLDSDDIAMPNRLGLQVEFLQKNTNYVLVGSGCKLIDDKGSKIGEEKRNIANKKLSSLLVFSNYFINSSVLFRAKAIENISFGEGTDLAEDYQFFTQLSLVGGIGNIDQSLIKYRIHSNNVSSKQAKDQRGKAKAIQYKLLQRLEITISDQELELHNQLVDTSIKLDAKEISKVEEWLLKIRAANSKTKVYDQESFNHWCSFFFQRACLKVKAGVKSYNLFEKSELSKGFSKSIKSNLTFFAKSILKKT